MKKRLIILLTSFILIFSASYASSAESKIPENIVSEFNHDFYFASNVNWEIIGDLYKSSFNIHDKTAFAFYTSAGEFMGIATYLSADQLPPALRNQLKSRLSRFWISDLFLLADNNTHSFYLTIENADEKIILKSANDRGWELYKTTKKP